MKCIYEASSGLEAHMILNLIQIAGVSCRIDGEYLQGGAGELQAMNMVRVLVDESDYKKAQEIINAWEATQVVKETTEKPGNATSGIGSGIFFGILIGAGATFWSYNSPVTLDGIDHNNDGKLDDKKIYKDNRLRSVEKDRNLDGRTDTVHSYDYKGRLYKSELDDDFDGVYESTVTYKRGNPILQESDLNNDGEIDYRMLFNNGVLYEVEIIDPASRIPRKIQTYKLNKLISSEFDSNRDGIYDRTYKYDFYEEIK